MCVGVAIVYREPAPLFSGKDRSGYSAAMASRRTTLQWFWQSALAGLCIGGLEARAQNPKPEGWPARPVRLIVPYSPGGVIETVARLMAERLAGGLGQAVIIENRAGAGGIAGIDVVAKSSDGLVFGLSAVSPLTLLPHLMRTPYNPATDFAAVATVMYAPVFLLATASFPGKTFGDVIALARQRPGQLSLATSGIGTIGHLMLEQIKRTAHVDILHVPYKGGGGQLIGDAAGGQFNLFTANPSANLNGLIATGKAQVLAVTGPARLPQWPGVLTLAELGFPLANLISTFGIVGPASTPPQRVQWLNSLINNALSQKDLQEKLAHLDNTVMLRSPQQFAAMLQSESAANAQIVREAKIELE